MQFVYTVVNSVVLPKYSVVCAQDEALRVSVWSILEFLCVICKYGWKWLVQSFYF